MKRQALLFAGLVSAGVVLGATFVAISHDTEDQATNDPRLKFKTSFAQNNSANTSDNFSANSDLKYFDQALNEIQTQLQQEIETRKKLESKIAVLEKRLNTVSQIQPTTGINSEVASTDVPQNPHQPDSTGSVFGSPGNNDWFNEQAMLNAGVDPTKVNYIKQSFEQAEMDKLYLRAQATREGWINSKRYTDAAREIADRTSALRSELNDNEYDAYLYAAGQSNRVIVSSILSASPASNAGIQPGDTILKYDNKRVYNWSDLTSATSEGSPNDTVTVTIVRDGQTQQVYIPRGPLGIRLTTDSVAP